MRTPFVMLAAAALLISLLGACGDSAGPSPPPPPPCDQACRDGSAIRAMRLTMKLAYNLTLQGEPVGAHDQTVSCPLGGSARIFGVATSNADQGTTDVDLTYVFDGCVTLEKDDTPKDNYRLALTGTVVQQGKLAVQPSATTALSIKSDAFSFAGTIYEPPADYQESCPFLLMQDANRVVGTLCGRDASTTL
ncbi:hypothetical protein [Labilithrix luteola]|nr:hypothetical protein [Labilithrix luteola]